MRWFYKEAVLAIGAEDKVGTSAYFIPERKTLYPNNSIRVQLTATGVYFVQIQSPLGTKTFKAIGSEKQTDYGVEITEETSSGVKFKSSFMTASTDFSFMEGDRIRMSVYKDEYYAPPSSLKISTSRSLNFEFRGSSVVKTGVSDAYVELDENTTNIAVYDTLSGLDEDTKVKKGDLRNFKFYLDSEAQFLTRLALEMSKSLEKENTKKLIDLRKVTARSVNKYCLPIPMERLM